jgi:isocitrate dehydrogenase
MLSGAGGWSALLLGPTSAMNTASLERPRQLLGADQDVINGSMILSGVMMFNHLLDEVGKIIEEAFAETIQQKKVTYDLERLMTGASKLKTSEFASAIIENMKG